MFKDLIKKILGRRHHPLNRILISGDNLIHNFNYLSSFSKNFNIAPVLKSNAYGHGVEEITMILDQLNAPFFCVDSLFEAYQLLKLKIKTPILIMGYIDPRNLSAKKLPFSYAVYDLELAKAINKYQKGASVHIKVDTGMHRLGVPIENLGEFLDDVKKLEGIKIEGLMSHFASVTSQKDPLFKSQLNNFIKAKQVLKKNGVNPKWFHIGASETVLNPEARKQIIKVSNMARAGKALYGYALNIDDEYLKPVLKFISRLVQIKKIKRGDRVGYYGTYEAKKDMLIGLLPLGYNDGVDRRLSNMGFVTINRIPCQYVGRISMNISAISLEKVNNPQVGQEVVVISDNPNDPNSILNIAKTCGTVPHDVLVRLVYTTRREVV